MEKATNTPHRIDDYLQRIEEREKSARRKKMIIAGLGVFALIAVGSLLFIIVIVITIVYGVSSRGAITGAGGLSKPVNVVG